MELSKRLQPIVKSTEELLGKMGGSALLVEALIEADKHLTECASQIFTSEEENEAIFDNARDRIIDSTILPGLLPEKLTQIMSSIIGFNPASRGTDIAKAFQPIMGTPMPGYAKRPSGLFVPKQTSEDVGKEIVVCMGMLNAAGLLRIQEQTDFVEQIRANWEEGKKHAADVLSGKVKAPHQVYVLTPEQIGGLLGPDTL